MTALEKILAHASHRKEVGPGDVVVANVDLMVLHDLSSNLVTKVFEREMGGGQIFDPARIAFVFDHTFSPPTQADADVLTEARRFAARHGIRVFDSGSGSIHHVIIESGLWAPGNVIIGCDSHTTVYGALGVFSTGVGNNSMAALGWAHGKAWFRVPETIQVFLHGELAPGVAPRDVSQYLDGYLGEDGAVYKAIEYAGPFIEALSMEDRLLFSLMAIDLGAKSRLHQPGRQDRSLRPRLLPRPRLPALPERPQPRLRTRHRNRRLEARTTSRLPANAGQREAHWRNRRHAHRPCRNRRQHGRPPH